MSKVKVCDCTDCTNNERQTSLLNIAKDVAIEAFNNGFISEHFNRNIEYIEKNYDLIKVCKPCFIKMLHCDNIAELANIEMAGYYCVIVFENSSYEKDFNNFKNDKMFRCSKYE